MKKELEELREQLKEKNKTNVPYGLNYDTALERNDNQIGNWNQALLQKTLKETNEMIPYKPMVSSIIILNVLQN